MTYYIQKRSEVTSSSEMEINIHIICIDASILEEKLKDRKGEERERVEEGGTESYIHDSIGRNKYIIKSSCFMNMNTFNQSQSMTPCQKMDSSIKRLTSTTCCFDIVHDCYGCKPEWSVGGTEYQEVPDEGAARS